MEQVWLKTESLDDKFAASVSSIKAEIDFDSNNEVAVPPIVIPIKEEVHDEFSTEADVLVKSENTFAEVECVPELESPQIPSSVQCNSTLRGSSKKKVGEEPSDKVKVKTSSEANTAKKSFECGECGQKFSASSTLKRHRLLHTGEKPSHICTECGAMFRQSSGLKSHQLMHAEKQKYVRRKYVCEECGGTFSSGFYLRIHQLSHTGERPFVCTECGDGFKRKGELAKHKLEHSGEKKFECDECGMRFFASNLLKSHKKTHSDSKPYICVDCGKGFYHNTSLNAHKRSHSTEKPFGCDICGKRFTQKGTLTVHKGTHSTERLFGCDICGLRFTQKFTLKTHQMKQHGLVLPSGVKRAKPKHVDQSVKKTPASKSFSSNDGIPSGDFERSLMTPTTVETPGSKIIHPLNDLQQTSMVEWRRQTDFKIGIRTHSPDGVSTPLGNDDEFNELKPKLQTDHNCETELSDPPNVNDLNLEKSERIEEVKEEKQFVNIPLSCVLEPVTVIEENGNVSGANKQKSGRKPNLSKQIPHICDICGKAFKKRHHMINHKSIHSDFKPYSCNDCELSFNQLGNYTSHLRTHTGERPFVCQECGMSFAQQQSLVSHRRTHSTNSKERRFLCDVCGKRFIHLESIKKHQITHTGEKPYCCDICGKSFIEKSYIKLHRRTHTGEKPFSCDQCPSTFSTKNLLVQHKAYSHRANGEPSPRQRRKLMKMMKVMEERR